MWLIKTKLMVAAMVAAVVLTGCAPPAAVPSDVKTSKEIQQTVMRDAFSVVPPYQPTNFPARESINRYLRETENAHEWYIYLLNRDGLPIYYFVADSKPMNLCVSITSSQRLEHTDLGEFRGNVVMQAPGLDGVYYGATDCSNTFYMFDSVTGGMIEISGNSFTMISSKVPLLLETDVARLALTQE